MTDTLYYIMKRVIRSLSNFKYADKFCNSCGCPNYQECFVSGTHYDIIRKCKCKIDNLLCVCCGTDKIESQIEVYLNIESEAVYISIIMCSNYLCVEHMKRSFIANRSCLREEQFRSGKIYKFLPYFYECFPEIYSCFDTYTNKLKPIEGYFFN